jgi:hypothetical protein
MRRILAAMANREDGNEENIATLFYFLAPVEN